MCLGMELERPERARVCLPGPALGLYPAASLGASQEQALDPAGQAAELYDYGRERQSR